MAGHTIKSPRSRPSPPSSPTSATKSAQSGHWSCDGRLSAIGGWSGHLWGLPSRSAS